ncbi:hypothetical protein D3C71_1335400 [compost metagenome]
MPEGINECGIAVIDHSAVPVEHQAPRNVAAHAAQSNNPQLHVLMLLNYKKWCANGYSAVSQVKLRPVRFHIVSGHFALTIGITSATLAKTQGQQKIKKFHSGPKEIKIGAVRGPDLIAERFGHCCETPFAR